MSISLSHFADTRLFDSERFSEQLSKASSPVKLFREALEQGQKVLDRRFCEGDDIRKLVYGRAWLIDCLVSEAWNRFDWPDGNQLSLIAVGGYGRGELHPHSDVDILLLLRTDVAEKYRDSIEGFLTLLWDIKLEVGSSVRTIEQCFDEARKDITVATNLIESRTLIGDPSLREDMYDAVTSDDAWSNKAFFKAKLQEQEARHRTTNETEYNLEPNIKTSPGGLRDIQTIGWVAKRHFGATYIHDLVDHGFLTSSELDSLTKGELYHWTVRYALHMTTDRCENRLLFDHQRTLAEFFGYKDSESALAVEQFMHKYYRVAMRLGELNHMLLQFFDEAILRAEEPDRLRPINSRFQVHNNYLETSHDNVFKNTPFALMEVFVLLAQNPDIEGVRASTIRLITSNRHLIDDDFRNDIRNTTLFMEILRSPERVTRVLKLMNRYGILGRYLPEFGRIIGQMQHDLFHIYTVDAHTLKVIENMRKFRHAEHAEKFPIAHRIVNQVPKIALLYIGGLFHDIAKGRGGDHSKLGAEDARGFCQRHRLGKWDTDLVAWLVENHLLMSMTAQRKDISDPDVIGDFANAVRDEIHLDYLYALTVADINATNHTLWNNWRATLMRQLYNGTKRILRKGTAVNKEDLIEQVQKEALEMLDYSTVSKDAVLSLWKDMSEDYFLREQPQDIVWHTEAILNHKSEQPLVLIKETSTRIFEGATQIFVYMRDQADLFAATTAALDQLHLNVQDARIITSNDNFTFDTYVVLSEDNQPIGDDPEEILRIRNTLIEVLRTPDHYPDIVQRRTPRQLKLFAMPTEVVLSNDPNKRQTTMELTTSDRPGLLARLGRVFLEYDITVQGARIVNIGERVEDIFYLTDEEGEPLEDLETLTRLQQRICQELDRQIEDA